MGAQRTEQRQGAGHQLRERVLAGLRPIDGAGDDPAVEQPQAFGKAMRAALDIN